MQENGKMRIIFTLKNAMSTKKAIQPQNLSSGPDLLVFYAKSS